MPPRSSLAKLRDIKNKKISRLEAYDDEEQVDDVYIEMDEDEYNELQNKRINDNFVQDDDGSGYADDGHDEIEQEQDFEESTPSSKSRKRKTPTPKTKQPETSKYGNVSKMFKTGNTSIALPKAQPKAGDKSIDDLIESIGSSSTKKPTGPRLGASSKLRTPMTDFKKPKFGLASISPLTSSPLVGSRSVLGQRYPGTSRKLGRQPISGPPVPAPVFRPSSESPLDAGAEQTVLDDDNDHAVYNDEDDDDMPVRSMALKAAPADIPSSEPSELSRLPSSPPLAPQDMDVDMESAEPRELVASVLATSASGAPSSPQQFPPSEPPTEEVEVCIENFEQNIVGDTASAALKKIKSSFNGDAIAPNGEVSFYWTDFTTALGSMILYGRLGKEFNYESVAVVVEKMYREVHFLPRQGMEMKDVLDEIEVSLMPLNMTILSKPVEKKYCFGEEGVPSTADYLQVRVPFSVRDEDLRAALRYKTYSHAFGIDSSMFERFAIGLNVMGPCWLKLTDVSVLNGATTNCQNTVSVPSPAKVSVDKEKNGGPQAQDAPPITTMTLSIRTIVNPSTSKPEILALTARFYQSMPTNTIKPARELKSVLITGIRPKDNDNLATVKFQNHLKHDVQKTGVNTITFHKSEADLLRWFADAVACYDPDVIIGHQLENITLGILLVRMKDLAVSNWTSLTRRSRNYRMPSSINPSSLKFWLPGRLVCDMANEMGKSITGKCDSWSLSEMIRLYTDEKRVDIGTDVTKSSLVKQGQGGLVKILRLMELDTLLITELAIRTQILPLSKQLTTLAGNAWARTLSGSRVDRNEYILLHEFTRHGYIVPNQNKTSQESNNGKAKVKYAGGRVFTPESGLYRSNVLVMDFNSLYPSIIQEYNICFTTIDVVEAQKIAEAVGDEEQTPELPPIPDKSVPMGLFPRLVQSLVTKRREVKKLMKGARVSEHEMAQYDIRQQALKLTANSMYGCLGFTKSRFYALPLAMLTTSKGREILEQTKALAEGNGLAVIYGDTDSVMINTNVTDFQETLKIGEMFKRKVNNQYQMLEIDIDNVFSSLLLTTKKKYAAVNVTKLPDGTLKSKIEVKGLDLRRREYSQISKDASMFALESILNAKDLDEALKTLRDYLEDLGKQLAPGKSTEVPIHKFIIRNMLSKKPQDYSPQERTRSAHVRLALEKEKRGDVVNAHDVIEYVITRDEANTEQQLSPAERARAVNDMAGRVVDTEYYLASQIFPPLDRICQYVPGIDSVMIATYLGIDVKKHKISPPKSGNSMEGSSRSVVKFESRQPDIERFADCSPLSLKCNCGAVFEYSGVQGQHLDMGGIMCPGCKTPFKGLRLHAQLENQIRNHISEYYKGTVQCTDSACGAKFRQVGVYGVKCFGLSRQCQSRVAYVYDEKMLYDQLKYFASMFDMERVLKRLEQYPEGDGPGQREKIEILAKQNSERMKIAKSIVECYISKSGREFVNMREIFAFA